MDSRRPRPAGTAGSPGLQVSIRGFRSLEDVRLRLEPTLVVLGEDGTAESELLRAVRLLVDRSARPALADFRRPDLPIQVELADASGRLVVGLVAQRSVDGVSLRRTWDAPDAPGRVLYLSAPRRRALRLADLFERLSVSDDRLRPRPARAAVSSAGSPLELVIACEVCIACGLRGAWILIEEPELYLGPQTQRSLAELLRALADCGNQVIYTTHSSAMVDGRRPDAIVVLRRDATLAMTAVQAPHLPPSDVPDLVRRMGSLDEQRSEMFFARRVLIVEGASERLSLPFAFRLLGHEPDAEGIAIVDAGGKGNIPYLARTLRGLRIPTVILHDRDAHPGRRPPAEEAAMNRAISAAAGRRNVVQMSPDFESVSGLRPHAKHKPTQAWLRYATMTLPSEIPPVVARAAKRLLSLPPRQERDRRRLARPAPHREDLDRGESVQPDRVQV